MRLIETRDAPKIGARTGGSEIREEEITWSPTWLALFWKCVELEWVEIQSEICKWSFSFCYFTFNNYYNSSRVSKKLSGGP